MCVCACVCECVKNFSLKVQKEKKYFLKWIGPQRDLYFLIIYFFLTYVYVFSLLLFSLLLSSENICGTRLCEWGVQWDTNSLVFISRMFFQVLPLYEPIQNLKIILLTNTRVFESHWVPHSHDLATHMFSYESNKLETYTYIKTKLINNF